MSAILAEPAAQPIPERVEQLLQALSGSNPSGPSLRFDPVFTSIRLDREEDDPSLPMRQWERPLKVADWPSVERRCVEFLRTRSKDLQMAAWTLEAWFRQRELDGLHDGLLLMAGLIERYWDSVHPMVDEDGDCDARVAPFEWLNEELPVWLRTRVVLARLPGYQPAVFTLSDWLRLASTDAQQDPAAQESIKSSKKDSEPPVPPATRELVLEAVRAGAWRPLVEQLQHCRAALHQTGLIDGILKDRLGVQSPSLAKMTRELEVLERVLQQVLAAAEMPQTQQAASPEKEPSMADLRNPAAAEPRTAAGLTEEVSPPTVHTRSWATREQAYATLEAVADFLARTEPHSPTPYLIRRAVNWGRMSLPELMAEIQREEGDLNKLVSLLNAGYREDPDRY